MSKESAKSNDNLRPEGWTKEDEKARDELFTWRNNPAGIYKLSIQLEWEPVDTELYFETKEEAKKGLLRMLRCPKTPSKVKCELKKCRPGFPEDNPRVWHLGRHSVYLCAMQDVKGILEDLERHWELEEGEKKIGAEKLA